MAEASTPMMSQYRRIRADLPADTILFFRLGDFYEMFFDEAKEVSQLLDLTLTKRQDTPMCGIPFHSADLYIAKLIKAGRKVAICEQVEDPALAKGLVRREVTKVITPGTVLEDHVLESKQNNYLAGLCIEGKTFGMAFLDLSTGAFWIEEAVSPVAVRENIARYLPSECVVPEDRKDDYKDFFAPGSRTVLTGHDDWTFEADSAADLLKRHFKVHSLDGFGLQGCLPGLKAAGAVLHYVQHGLRRQADHIRQIRVKNPAEYMLLDETTVSNLDLVESRAGVGCTLLGVLDATKTSMGGRLLRDWVVRPLTDAGAINRRLDAVEALVKERSLLLDLREAFLEIKDLERLIARLNAGTGNGRDVRGLGRSLAGLPKLKALLAGVGAGLLRELDEQVTLLPDIVELIDRAIEEEPPIPIKEGGLIKRGYHPELDDLKDAATKGRQWLAEYQAREQERTGIKSLKVRHNSVFGYYIEVTKSNLERCPRSTSASRRMVNAERFITPELKEYENKILGAQERSHGAGVRSCSWRCAKSVPHRPECSSRPPQRVAELDCSPRWPSARWPCATCARSMTAGDACWIRDGRHPVIEQPAPRGALRAERRHLLDDGADQIAHHHRPEHGRQVHLHPPGRGHRGHGPDRLLRPRGGGDRGPG
jgi:DNA mismatch repair protein MutS